MLTSLVRPIIAPLMGISVVGLSVLTAPQISLAQTAGHSSHHHLMIGRDNLQILTSGTYAGLPNPNYNRLSLLFPHLHDPVSTSGLHAIGIYSYTGPAINATIIATNTNNQLPEIGKAPALPLTPGTGVFTNKMVSGKTEDNMYSDLKMKPLDHLTDDLAEPFVQAIYNAGNGRWNDLLGDDASISIELVAVSPGLGIANEQGQDLFNAVGDTYLVGQGDHFSFTPIFYASPSTSDQNYSASFRLIDTNTSNNRTPWLSSGTFSINVQTSAVPEPSNFVGALAFVGMMGFFRFYKKLKNQ